MMMNATMTTRAPTLTTREPEGAGKGARRRVRSGFERGRGSSSYRLDALFRRAAARGGCGARKVIAGATDRPGRDEARRW